jgi:hypothetical protein
MRDGTVLSTSSCGPDFIACVLASRDAGGARRWQRRVPGALDLVRDTPYGTLTLGFDASATDGLLRLGDPRTGRVRRDFGRTGFALAASDRQVAWRAPGCERPACPISVADLASGTVKTVHLPAGYTSVGTFSPDGRKLAIGFQGLHEQDPTPIRRRDGYVAVVDLATGRWVRAPGLTTGPKSSPAPVWTPDGSELLVVAADDGAGRVVRWRPGADRITVLPTELDGIYPGQRTVLVLG